MMDRPPRRVESARAVRDMIRGLKESGVSAATGSKSGLSSARGAPEREIRWGFRDIGGHCGIDPGTKGNRNGNVVLFLRALRAANDTSASPLPLAGWSTRRRGPRQRRQGE